MIAEPNRRTFVAALGPALAPLRLTLLVTGEGEARRAAALLESQGYDVIVSAVIDEGAA